MDLGLVALLLTMSVLGTNQLVMRLRALQQQAAVFWTLEALNLAFAVWVLWRGLPGFDHQPVVSLVVGLLVLLHGVQNLSVRQRVLADLREEEAEEARRERADAIREKLGDADQ